MARRKLTQAQVLAAINAWVAEHRIPPSIEELRKVLGVGSKRTAQRYLKSLEQAGDIERFTGRARGLKTRRIGRHRTDEGGSAVSLPHGRAITAEEIERIVSREFSPQRFAGLCNAIAWAVSRRRCTSIPSFTERVNAKDNGIDAEWQVEIPEDGAYASPVLGPGWGVFQYKQREVFAQGRDRTVAGLARGLEGAAEELAQRTGRRPSRYTLFTNIDLTHVNAGQKERLKEQILRGWPRNHKLAVQIVGAGELASFLNSAPAVRSAFFAPAKFSTWEEAWRALTKSKLFGASTPLTGRDAELEQVRSLLDDTSVRAVVLAGPHEIGKSRLALQASDRRPTETVVALDPRSMSAGDLLALEPPDNDVLVIIEDPDAEKAEDFVREAITRDRLKVLITLPTVERAPAPNFGRDERVRVIRLGPLSDKHSEELLRTAGATFDYGLESWVIHQAGGNPGVLLLAASVGVELRRSAASFVEDVARAFEHKVAQVLGDTAVKILGSLSLLTHVGVSGPAARELELVCRLFGEGLSPHAVLNALPKLADAGVVRVGGAYAEVVPPLFATALAGSALQARFTELFALFGALSQAGRLRLIRRLRGLRADEATRFWNELFASGGLFNDLDSALANSHLLRLIASAVPERVARLVEEGLQQLTLEERRGIRDEARRELMWAIEELLFRKKASGRALRALALLAEAENERYGNNATGVFSEVFHPLHPQMPLPLDERLGLLRELLQESRAPSVQVIAVKAIETALGQSTAIMLRRSEGPEPLDSRPTLTYGAIWNYMDAIAGLLMEAAQSGQEPLASAAQSALPHALAECAIQARPEQALAQLKTLTAWVTTGSTPIPVSDLADALAWVRDEFDRRRKEGDEQARATFAPFVTEIETLITTLDGGDFATRLRRWAGKWSREDHEMEEDEGGQQIYRSEKELRALASEAAEDPKLLTADLLAWLCSGEAQKAHTFFWWLGRVDATRHWQANIEALATAQAGLVAFAPYFGGLSRSDRALVSHRLDELTADASVSGEAIVSATGWLGGDAAGVDRVERLLAPGRVDPRFTARTLSCGGWINPLSPEEYLRLLKAIAGEDLRHAAAVIDFLGMWLHGHRPVEGELADFAWRCLESAPRAVGHESYHCEQLAAHLTRSDPERGLRLLEMLLTRPHEHERWDPLGHRPDRKFWSALLLANRERALRLVLSLAFRDPVSEFHISWNLREILDQEHDAAVLVAYALENERHAELISSTITAGRPGFWPIALRIADAYPGSERILGALTGAAEHQGLVIRGPLSAHSEACRREVERVRSDSTPPPGARPWLQRVEEYLRERSERELLSEIEEDVNDVRKIVEDPAAPERLWAITSLLRLGKAEEVTRLVSKAEMQKILPKLSIPAKDKQKIRRLL